MQKSNASIEAYRLKFRVDPAVLRFSRHMIAALICVLGSSILLNGQNTATSDPLRYTVTEGTVHFVSDAPLERIEATSRSLRGLVETSGRTFAFSLDIVSFQGFNSPLQRIHFNENYMESGTYPVATFTGKLIEDVDLTRDGTHDVRVKGKLRIHGVEKERIIKASIDIAENTMEIESDFTILLEDHNIRIPRVVHQKIAQVVVVKVRATLSANSS